MNPSLEPRVEDDGLRKWRRQATDFVVSASVLLHLPVVALYLLQYSHTSALSVSVTIFGSYFVVVLAALFRRIDYRIRVWAVLGAIYATACVGILAFPQGPYVRLLPILAPVFAIGVLGIRAARLATVISSIVLLSTPFLDSVPSVFNLLGIEIVRTPMPGWLDWVQATALTAEMVVVMILLERSYGFLLSALAARGRAIAEQRLAKRRLEELMHERLRLELEVARIGDDERRQLGNEVHDGVCQQLTGALLRCQALELRLEQGTPLCGSDLEPVSSLLSDSINEAHSIAQGLWPLEPTPEALVSALRRLVKRTRKTSGIPCEFRSAGDVRVSEPNTAQHLYRIAQEALSNAVRHAKADHITLELRGSDGTLTLRVEDNGIGLHNSQGTEGMGLRTMACRAQILESEFIIEAAPLGGTRVLCCVPRLGSDKRSSILEVNVEELAK